MSIVTDRIPALGQMKHTFFDGVTALGRTVSRLASLKKREAATRLLFADRLEYQRPYLEATVDCLQQLQGVRIESLPCTSRTPLVRVCETFANALYDPALVFHFFPHQTHYYPRTAAHVSMPHGFATGRSFHGETIYGERHLLNKKGAPLYRALFVGSEWERTLAVQQQPSYSDRTFAVGDLRLDALQAMVSQREAIRRRMGIAPGEKVVLVISSWGESSLLDSYSDEVVSFLSKPPPGVRPLLSVHQFARKTPAWARLVPQLRPWQETSSSNDEHVGLLDYRWEEPLAAVDGCIFDHSSLAFYAAGIDVPIVRVAPAALPQPEAPLASFDASMKPCARFGESVEVLLEMMNEKTPRNEVLAGLFVHRGKAAKLHLEAVRSILASV